MELSEVTKTFLEAAFSATMLNEDRKKRIGKIGVPDYDQTETGRCVEGCIAQRRHKGGRVFVTSAAVLARRGGSPSGFAGERGGRGFDARKGGFGHPDCPVLNGERASANGTRAEEEADSKIEPFAEVHGGG